MAESQIAVGIFPPLPWPRREPMARPQSQSFVEIIQQKHEKAGLPYPLNGPWLEDRGELAKVVAGRISKADDVRKAVALKAQEVYGPQSDEAHALRIFRDIAHPLDEIFVAQLRAFKGEAMSWRQANRGAVAKLIINVKKIEESVQYKQFFQRYPETLQALQCVAGKVVDETSPQALASAVSELERHTLESYKRGGPIFAFSLSQFFTNPGQINDPEPKVLDARAQLMFPPQAEERARFSRLVQAAWERHSALSSVNGDEKPLGHVFGTAVGWAGSELVSYTTGEQLTGERCLVLLTNLFKRQDVCKRLFGLAGLRYPSNIENYFAVHYSLHETGHDFDQDSKPGLEEIVTDIPSFIAGIEMVRDQDPAVASLGVTDLKTYLATLVFDSAQQVMDQYTDPSVKGYYVSSYFLLDRLFQHGILSVSDTSLSIDAAPGRVDRFLSDLINVQKRLVTKDTQIIDELLATRKTDSIDKLLHLLSKNQKLS